MVKKIEDYLKTKLDIKLVINQQGFITSTINIDKMNYNIQNDILIIKDEISINFISINVNQLYKVEMINNMLKIYVDNDTKIIFS